MNIVAEVNSSRWLSNENYDGEMWKDIPSYEGLYEASNMGRIKSKERYSDNYYVREKILTQKLNQRYFYVTLRKDGKVKTLRVHRLIAKAFLPNPDNLPEVNHKDENTVNNAIWNLEWCDSNYNLNYGTRIERGVNTKESIKKGAIKKQLKLKTDSKQFCCLEKFQTLEGEEWRPVAGYEGLYEVSNFGRVKSLQKEKAFIVRTKTIKSGRIQANMHKHGEVHTFGVHVLVAKAFIPNPHNLVEVNHKDENPANNNVNNLEWCTHEYNMRYGTLRQRLSSRLKNHSSTSQPVAQYNFEGKLIRVFPSIREVKRTLSGTGWKTICDACSGKLHSAIGFQWRYIKEGEEPTADIGPICRRCSTAPKAVYQYTLGGVFVRRYESITEAGLAVGIASTNISACIKGKQKSAAGFLWSDKILNT